VEESAYGCPYQKVHLVAHQHIPPRDLNAARAVGSLCPSADLDVGAHVVFARSKGGDQVSGSDGGPLL
jgi:hypothetical protein